MTRGRALGSPALLRIGKEVGQVLFERTLIGALAPFSGTLLVLLMSEAKVDQESMLERMRRLTD